MQRAVWLVWLKAHRIILFESHILCPGDGLICKMFLVTAGTYEVNTSAAVNIVSIIVYTCCFITDCLASSRVCDPSDEGMRYCMRCDGHDNF